MSLEIPETSPKTPKESLIAISRLFDVKIEDDDYYELWTSKKKIIKKWLWESKDKLEGDWEVDKFIEKLKIILEDKETLKIKYKNTPIKEETEKEIISITLNLLANNIIKNIPKDNTDDDEALRILNRLKPSEYWHIIAIDAIIIKHKELFKSTDLWFSDKDIEKELKKDAYWYFDKVPLSLLDNFNSSEINDFLEKNLSKEIEWAKLSLKISNIKGFKTVKSKYWSYISVIDTKWKKVNIHENQVLKLQTKSEEEVKSFLDKTTFYYDTETKWNSTRKYPSSSTYR